MPEVETIAEKVRKIITENLADDNVRLTDGMSLTDELGLDSLEVSEIAMDLEERFDIEIPVEDIEKMKTVGDVIKYIERRLEP